MRLPQILSSLLLAMLATASFSQVDPQMLAGLKWRNIGPFRGGRASAVSGALGQAGVFYIGLPAGGVWKTTSAGTTWYPIFDSIKDVSSIGSVAVSPSDPNTIYVGTGDMVTGGGINEGNGVYKSTDAGKTWSYLGLPETKQIPAILVDPKDPNIVLVAAQGNIHTHTKDRGVFRSTDGGRTWTKTLYVDNETGAQSIAYAFDQPNIVFATTVRHYFAPGASGRGGGGGFGQQNSDQPTGTSLFKSKDGGVTWVDVADRDDTGLPRLSGRMTVAVAQHTSGQRVYLIGTFGLYRSDNGGDSWRQVAAKDRRIRNGQGNYTSGVFVDPANPDMVYTLATSSYRSIDGGNTFTGFKGAPGGDDPQVMWIDPTDGSRMILGVDQGATVSLDAGQTWSSWYNQATAQVYHISVDNQFPYWVYATQQDSGSIGTRTRGNLGQITPFDWVAHPGYEFGSIVADPLNPNITYAGGPGRGLVKVSYPSGQWIDVSPNLDTSLSLRQVSNQPLGWNPHNPHMLLAGFQYLMATTDGGTHWKKLSPDMAPAKTPDAPPAAPTATKAGIQPTKKQPLPETGRKNEAAEDEVPDKDSDLEEEQRGRAFGGSIESFSWSTVTPNVIWAGTNNGLIKVTRDGGKSWQDASIPNLPTAARADIACVDSSHQDAATAYAAVDLHGTADYAPYFYRTHDFGKTWTKIVDGLPTNQPSGSFSRCIRADTKKAGLLFASTESGMYVSLDDGSHWQTLTQDLPNTSYRDMAIHDNDLVVGTYGRAIWVLDDYSPLRQISPASLSESAHLYAPGDAIRFRRNVNGDTPFPPEVPRAPNPPVGAILYYSLGAKPQSPISLEISDSSGNVIRHMSSIPSAPSNEPPAAVPDFWHETPHLLATEIGLNRTNWDLRTDAAPSFSHDISSVMGAVPGDTPAPPEGALVPPGTYVVTLHVDVKSYSEKVVVKNDPRSPATQAAITQQYELQRKLIALAKEAYEGYTQVAAVRASVAGVAKTNPPAEVAKAAEDLDAKLAGAGGNPSARRFFFGGFGADAAAKAPSFVEVNGTMLHQLDTLQFGDLAPTEAVQKAYAAGVKDLQASKASWAALCAKELVAFNALLVKNNLRAVSLHR